MCLLASAGCCDVVTLSFYSSSFYLSISSNKGGVNKEKASKSQTVRDVKKRESERKSRDALRSDDASDASDSESPRMRPQFSTGTTVLSSVTHYPFPISKINRLSFHIRFYVYYAIFLFSGYAFELIEPTCLMNSFHIKTNDDYL